MSAETAKPGSRMRSAASWSMRRAGPHRPSSTDSASRRTVSSNGSSAPKRSFTVAKGAGSLISFLAAKAIETSRRW